MKNDLSRNFYWTFSMETTKIDLFRRDEEEPKKMRKVVKFGGSSLANAQQLKKSVILSTVMPAGGMWCRPHLESVTQMT